MDKNILVISTSPRRRSNSEALADAFIRGACEAGNRVQKVSRRDKTIGFCQGCLACQKTQRCVIHDDAGAIVQNMLTADVIVFAKMCIRDSQLSAAAPCQCFTSGRI